VLRERLKRYLLTFVLLLLVTSACQPGLAPDSTPIATLRPTDIPATNTPADPFIYKDSTFSPAERAVDLLARMSLAEKIGQMTQADKGTIKPSEITEYFIGSLLSGGGGSPNINTPEKWAEMVDGFQEAAMQTPLGIPLIYGVDAVHGHNNVKGATIFPHNIGLGAADDELLMQRIGRATALEMAATGIRWDFAPVVAVPQDIRWGRTYEGYSSNTEVVSRLGTAYLRGLQEVGDGLGLANPRTAMATPKHFIGDGGTTWGTSTISGYQIDQGVTEVDEATLRELYLPPYKSAVDAGARSIMVSYSSWDGIKMHGQKYLLTDVLKGEFGFTGFLVSDWQAIDQLPGDYYSDIVTSINAGLDLIMVPTDWKNFITYATQAVEQGDIPMERIDDAVLRILTVKFEMGLFENPYSDPTLLDVVGSDEHRALAREAVAKSLVLLKNEKETLPLSIDTPLIFVAGTSADNLGLQLGGWSITWQGQPGNSTTGTTILEGIQAAVSDPSQVRFNRFGKFEDEVDGNGRQLVADVGIVIVGEQPYAEGRGDDADLSLSNADISAIERTKAVSRKLVIILVSGRPMVVTDQIKMADAFVAAWLPGTEGAGVADGLFGVLPINGKLPYAWLTSADHLPLTYDSSDALFSGGYGLITPGAYTLVWSDEFDGPEINRENWKFNKGGGGWGNAEYEYYTDRPENARIENGMLVIEARKEKYKKYPYTSARMLTQGLQGWTFGRIEARIKVPYGQGIWSGFWMLGTGGGWPYGGEIDIMEIIGKEPDTLYNTIHGPGYSDANGVGSHKIYPYQISDAFHVFSVEWEPDVIRWYVDGELTNTVTADQVSGNWVFNEHDFFIILNVSVGGRWPGKPDETTQFPQQMLVDYVRVYQQVP